MILTARKHNPIPPRAMTYTPKAGDPPAANIHFLQIYSQSLDGGPVTYHVDNNGLANTPFYDQVPGTPVQRPRNGTAWFEDEPFECENNVTCSLEGKEDHFAEFQFGVYVTVDNFDAVNNVHRVSVYAGKQWGYSYGTLDLPEPSGMFLTGAGLLAVLARKRFNGSTKFCLFARRFQARCDRARLRTRTATEE